MVSPLQGRGGGFNERQTAADLKAEAMVVWSLSCNLRMKTCIFNDFKCDINERKDDIYCDIVILFFRSWQRFSVVQQQCISLIVSPASRGWIGLPLVGADESAA